MPVIDTEHFSHVRRMTDKRFPHDIASILPGEFFVSRKPMVVYTVLGSCISACIRDPISGVGGMNHFMLPAPKEHHSGDAWGGESTRYGSFAMQQLINGILQRGGMKQRLEVKPFGAGKIYGGNIEVGVRNTEWVLTYLKAEGFGIAKSDLGDVFPRIVYYFTDSGRVLMKKIERIKNRTIHERETAYQHKVEEEQQQPQSDITLFESRAGDHQGQRWKSAAIRRSHRRRMTHGKDTRHNRGRFRADAASPYGIALERSGHRSGGGGS